MLVTLEVNRVITDMRALQQRFYWKVQWACGCRQGAHLAATPFLASLVPSTLPGRAHIGCLFLPFPVILLGLLVVRGPPSAAAW